MAATRGPVPKRSTERRRTNDVGPITKGRASSKVKRPPANGKWHPIAKRMYQSLAQSGQVEYMEPSDWAFAYFIVDQISDFLYAPKKSAVMFAAIEAATSRMMMTEGDRRRLRIELERGGDAAPDPDQDAAVTSLAEWQKKLGSPAASSG